MANLPTLTIVTPRGPGRPKAAEPSSVMSVYLPQRMHDRIVQLALERRVSVSSIARQLLSARVKP